MSLLITPDQWAAVRNSFREASERFVQLATSVTDPQTTMATAEWSVADTAAHLVTISRLYVSVVRTTDAPPVFPGIAAKIRATTVDTVEALNEAMLAQLPERDLEALVRSLRSDVDQILAAAAVAGPAHLVEWLGGAKVPVAGLLAHFVNELLIHGWDISRATGAKWEMPPREAALFFEVFMLGMTRCGLGRLLDGGGSPRDRRIAVEFRSRCTSPVTLVLRNGVINVDEEGGAPDVHLWFDPPSLNLMLFGRISPARVVLTGKVIAWGRRPWLLPVFLRTVRTPNRRRTG